MKLKMTIWLALLANFALAQSTNFWIEAPESSIILPRESVKTVKATSYRTLELNIAGLQAKLQSAPMEFTSAARRNPLQVAFPMPDGTMEVFEVVESPIMEPGLAARYPNIKTFKGKGLSQKNAIIRFGLTARGLHAVIHNFARQVYIDPLAESQTTYYQVYDTKNAIDEAPERKCGVIEQTEEREMDTETNEDSPLVQPRSGVPVNLHIYRMAVATSGELASRFNATTKSEIMDIVVDMVNRINVVFETDMATRFILAENTDAAFFLDEMNDPFTNGSSVSAALGQSQAVINANVGSANYDIGHVLIGNCPGNGAVGAIPGGLNGSVCNDAEKGFGTSCVFSVSVSAIEIFAHEVGHQFSARHSWSNCPSSIEQLSSSTAYEPGGGNTIMSYAGSCGNQNYQSMADAYFHTVSLEEMITYSRVGEGATCAAVTPTNNDEPVVSLDYKNGFYIPIRTPFALTANATDENGDPLTYSWEQYNLGPTSPLGMPMGNAPTFRSFPPTNSPTRTFPRISEIVNNNAPITEVLPTYNRDLTFRATVRDNHPGAGVSVWKQVSFKSTDAAGPFLLLHPNADTIKWTAGTYTEVRWDVANTDNDLVNCQTVNIKLSVDGGFTYPITLVESVPNNGQAMVPVPDVLTNRARIRVEAADNIFFDISNQSFEIQEATQASYTLSVAPRVVTTHCLPAALEFRIDTKAFLGFNSPIAFELLGVDALPADVSMSFSKSSILPSESATLVIDFATQVQGTYNLQVRGTSANGQSITIPISFSTVSNDFSAFQVNSPNDGKTGIILSSDFIWSDLPNADYYDFQLATSPVFNNSIIESEFGITDTMYRPDVFFDENTLYFWRIRPGNKACGDAEDYLGPYTFHTATVACEETASANVPINISGTGLPTINSTLTIANQGIINDINIPFIKGSYQPVNSLRVKLISPIGTEVVLFDRNCGTTLRFETGFDDESPTAITCPPDDRVVVRPLDSLAAFIGENTAGTWTLQMQVVRSGFGGGGALENWNIEFCSTFTPNDPFIVNNDTLRLPPNARNNFTINELEVQDTDNDPAELVYTLVSLPEHGDLTLSGTKLQVGNTFSQLDINALRILYAHNGDDNLTDGFVFVVQDGTGGFIPPQRANVVIDPNATTSIDEIVNAQNVRIFPNPTRDVLNIQLEKAPQGSLFISMYNVQGQELLRQRFDQGEPNIQVSTATLAAGMYFLTLRTETGVFTQKISVQH